jgi:hypothetical protein
MTTNNSCFKRTLDIHSDNMLEIKSVRSETILHFEIKELTNNKIEAKFTDTGGESVKEYLNIYQDGDDRYNLIALMLQVMELGDSYECWSKTGKAKKLDNTMKWALNGKAKKKWTEITNKRMHETMRITFECSTAWPPCRIPPATLRCHC